MRKFLSLGYLSLGAIYAGISTGLWKGLHRLPKARPVSHPPESNFRVSVIIAARNEEKRINGCLRSLINQNIPPERLQVIFVNDRSTDATGQILERHKLQRSDIFDVIHISDEEVKPGVSPKKYAISRAFEKATGDIILSTDADSQMGPDWVKTMTGLFAPGVGLVQGMTICGQMESNPLFNGIQALEYFSLNLVSAAVIGAGFPIHGNANNLAYRREIFAKTGVFSSNQNIVSGDDDFLLQSITTSGEWKVIFSTSPLSLVTTQPAINWLQFWEQRKRWASKCIYYKTPQLILLSIIFAFYAITLVMMLAGIFFTKLFLLGSAGWIIKTMGDWFVMKKGSEIFAQKHLMNWFIPTALIHIPLIVAAVIGGNFGSFTWKGLKSTGKIK